MKKYIVILLIGLCTQAFASASTISLVQTRDLYTGLVAFDIMLDPEGGKVNAFSGDITFPKDMLDVESISTEGSIVPLWLRSPQVANKETFLSSKGNIAFEGIMPGGFEGVYNLYKSGKNAGKLFSITFRPKKEGEAGISFSNITVLKHDGNGTKDTVQTTGAMLSIPSIQSLSIVPKASSSLHLAAENTLDAYVTKDNAISFDKWALVISDDPTKHTIIRYEVAESTSYDVNDVSFYEWEEVSTPFVLNAQKRNRFIHVKAIYADGTYNRILIPPVENIERELAIWRILMVLALGLILLYLLQKKHSLHGTHTPS